MKRTTIGIFLAAGFAATAMATEAEETSVSAAATYLYLATLCGEAPEHEANARQLGDILRRLGGSGTATMRAEMAVLHEIAEIENQDGSVDSARKDAFCAENKKVLTALGPEVEMWIRELSTEDQPLR